MSIVTYEAKSADIKPEWSWVAYIVLPNGEYLGIMFRDYTKDGVVAKAEQFWLENYKPVADAAVANINDRISEIGKANAGKVWMIHKVTREKRRMEPEIAEPLLASGEWERGGARSR